MFRTTLALLLALGAAQSPAQSPTDVKLPGSLSNQVPADQTQGYIIKFREPGLMYNDGQGGFAATSLRATGSRKLQSQTPAAKAYLSYLRSTQDNYVAAIDAKIGRQSKPTHFYDITMSGIGVWLTQSEADAVRGLAGIASVEPAGTYEINTDAGPNWIGANAIWTGGTATFTGTGTRGQGITIGVFDSGANQDHPSFANDASCGFSAANAKVVAFRDCNQSGCVGGDPEDTSTASGGHGVHTSSTAAGNSLTPPLNVGGVELKWPISGVAPCAKLITYKICTDTCPGTAIAAAIQKSITDDVDVVNFSVSGGTNPWNDNDRGFLDMVNADIFVAASAGNTRAAPNNIAIGAVNHRGPWVMTVANSTHDRIETNPVSLAGSLQSVPSQTSNGTVAGGTAFTTTVNAQVATGLSLGNEFGCTASGAFPANSMTGKIALIQRGPLPPGTACGFSEKINNAAAAGAIGVVIYNHSPGTPISMDVTTTPTTIPAVMIRQAAGNTLRDFLATNPTAQMTIVAPAVRVTSPTIADILNASSLRGPNIVGTTTVGTNTYLGSDTTKPDITAPGTNIYAAVNDVSGQFGFLTGTSMSSPHIAGAAALIRAANPTWTVPEVKSAMMLTANSVHLRENEITPTDPDDIGSGRVDLRRAATSGLVMNETFANFLAANPATAGNQNSVRALNLPNYRNTDCTGGVCTFTRTFRNTRTSPTSWAISTALAPTGTTITAVPANFSFNGGLTETQSVTFTLRITQPGGLPLPTNGFPKFGYIQLTPTFSRTFPADNIFAFGFEDAPTGPPLALTVAIAGPQAP